MTDVANNTSARNEEELRLELLRCAYEFERESARRGETPDRDRVLHVRLRVLMEFVGATLLALNTAAFALLGNYLVFNKILHWTF